MTSLALQKSSLNKLQTNNPSSDNRPIGVFDSGVGGISVLKHIHTLLPRENLYYVADSKHAPYGNKTCEEIAKRCIDIADFLIARNVKALVAACNTATAAAIDILRAKYDCPIIGMEPALKPAAQASKNGIIGVLATVGTLKSAQFAALLENYGRNVKVVTQACVGLVEYIERGEIESPETKALITNYCKPLLDEGADTIVLGCTHYPFVKQVIQEIVGDKITLIDTGAAVAKQLKLQLQDKGLLTCSQEKAEVHFWTNSEDENASEITEKLWGYQVKCCRL